MDYCQIAVLLVQLSYFALMRTPRMGKRDIPGVQRAVVVHCVFAAARAGVIIVSIMMEGSTALTA